MGIKPLPPSGMLFESGPALYRHVDDFHLLNRNESFAFSAAPATQPKLFAWVYDHKTLGKDKQLGMAEIDVSRRLLNLLLSL